MKIILHTPPAGEESKSLDRLISSARARYIATYVQQLNCPTEQKRALLDAIASTVKADSYDR